MESTAADATELDSALVTDSVTDLALGVRVFAAEPVRGKWRRLSSPDDVLTLMDSSAEGVVACVADAGATFLAPIFDELTAIVCLSGTPLSHIGIVSREYQVPCVMSAAFHTSEPDDGDTVEIDCSSEQAVIRRVA
jgi:signal transduction protein with GAF and PtsI domain